MSLLFFTHPACERHATGTGHPERPQRLVAIRRAIDASGLMDVLTPAEAPEVDQDLLESIHARSYINQVGMLARTGGGWLDADTAVSPHSEVAARAAAGAAQRAVEALCGGEADRAFVVVRPPGHHALPDRGMGFCLFNNVAVAAAAARRAGRQRVMIIDWDVHHGNGTQAIFWQDPSVLFVSLHQEYWYPGTGALEELGEGTGEGFTVNLPLPADTGDGGYTDAFTEVVLPLVTVFRPDLLIVSAGYDAHQADPLGGMVLTTAGFGRLTRLVDGAARGVGAPLLAILEGGYHLDALSASVVATLEVLAGRASERSPDPAVTPANPFRAGPPSEVPPSVIGARLRAARRLLVTHWRI